MVILVTIELLLQDRWSPLMIAREIGHLSPLMTASEIGHYELVKTLIDAGAEVSETNKVL